MEIDFFFYFQIFCEDVKKLKLRKEAAIKVHFKVNKKKKKIAKVYTNKKFSSDFSGQFKTG